MSTESGGDDAGLSATHVAIVAFGLVLVVFAALSETRPFVFALVWILGPVVAFGSLLQVFRGHTGLKSARTIIFALICSVLAFFSIPLGYLIVDESIGQALRFFGLFAAMVAIAFARFSLEDEPTENERFVPGVDLSGTDPFDVEATDETIDATNVTPGSNHDDPVGDAGDDVESETDVNR